MAADPSYPEVERALLGRWPETRLDPSLDRIRALCDLLGDPQHGYAVVHLTGTNGKTSTSRMIDALLTGSGLRTGRYTSPHLQLMTERITLDGEPLTPQQFVAAYLDVQPYVDVVDRSAPQPLSFFEVLTGMAYAAFADAPVDAAVVEVGMGGTWDATNVADGQVAVVTPVAVDHAAYLGDDPVGIAVEKSGIIKAGAMAVLARQTDEITEVLQRRAAEVGATVALEGADYGLADRVPGAALGSTGPVPWSRLAEGVQQSRMAAEHSRARGGGPTAFGDLAAPGLASLLDPAATRSFAESLLAPLHAADRAGAGDLVRSLRVWLTHHGQWEPAATQLGVHRHTLRKRVNRAAELLGRDLDEPGTRAELWLALHPPS